MIIFVCSKVKAKYPVFNFSYEMRQIDYHYADDDDDDENWWQWW